MPIIDARKLTKKFGDFTANNAIDLTVEEGEIKAIVGENGAGKTTLMNMIYGLLTPTSGMLCIRGKEVEFTSPTDAIEHGIGMVHQHFKLVPSLSVYENVLLGIEMHKTFNVGKKTFRLPFIDRGKEKEKVQNIIDEYGFKLDANQKVKNLSVGAKQKVEILKMLYRNVDIVIFDEPTAVLTPQETRALFTTMREMKNNGKTLLLITHKLNEVMEISDSVTVIKSGEVVRDVDTASTDQTDLARRMVGRDVLLEVDRPREKNKSEDVIYETLDLTTKDSEAFPVVNKVSFSIRKGEILGLAGVEGNGQSELVKLLTGLMCSTEGKVLFKGEDITDKWPGHLRKKGIGIVPEDRYIHGLCEDMSIGQNCIAGYHDQEEVCKHGILLRDKIASRRNAFIHKYDIRVSDKEALVSSMSGGNAQKIILAREFEADPDVLIASQPTRGVDIGAIEFIHNSLLDFAAKGKAVLLISSELSEIMTLSDRVAVMYKGQIIGERKTEETTREELGLLMAGVTEGKEDRDA